MGISVRVPQVSTELVVLLGVADRTIAQEFSRELVCYARRSPISIASTLPQLREISKQYAASIILLDEDLLGQKPLIESLRSFTLRSAVVLLGSPERQDEVIRLVAEGNLEFVARTGNFVPLAVSLIERRIRWIEMSESAFGPPWAEFGFDVGEIFRHEINNPLTGILGNAEILLGQGERFAAVETQRLQTVVDLAVRLRETIRRLSDTWERQRHAAKAL